MPNVAGEDYTSVEELRAKLALIESILESAHNGVLTIDNNGILVNLNKAAEKILRCDRKRSVGKHLSEVIPELGLLEVLKTGEAQLAQKITLDFPRGARSFMTHRTPIVKNSLIVGAVTVFQEISEIEAISHELSVVKQLNKELVTVIGASYDGILVTDNQGTIVRANGEGWLAEMIQNDEVRSMISEVIVPRVIKECRRISELIELDERQLAITGNPVFNGLEIEKVVINVRDLTELNNLRQALKASKQLSKRYLTELSSLNLRYLEENGIIVNSKPMEQALSLAVRVADVDATVLILGESGSGKQIIANLIHHSSKRVNKPFVKVNCGAIPDNLLESELFGYSPGAFTGASRNGKAGLFEIADKGTIFLDEIGELPLSLQVKLLHAIQDKVVCRVGSNRPYTSDVRIMAATHRDLEKMVESGQFREDLFFRLNVVPIRVPPLRERREDIVPMIKSFETKYNKLYGSTKEISPLVMQILLDYSWPGNVRELENLVERMLVIAQDNVITPADLPEKFRHKESASIGITVRDILPLRDAVREVERQLINKSLLYYNNSYKAAAALSIDQSTLIRKINRLKDLNNAKH